MICQMTVQTKHGFILAADDGQRKQISKNDLNRK
jgi:hypothetical protein